MHCWLVHSKLATPELLVQYKVLKHTHTKKGKTTKQLDSNTSFVLFSLLLLLLE